MRTTEIPMHRMDATGHLGIEIHTHPADAALEARVTIAHRDDHYTFGFLESGRVDMMVDFEPVSILPGMAFFLSPGQVHQLLHVDAGAGWMVAMDATLVSDMCVPVFDSPENFKTLLLRSEQVEEFRDCARLLHSLYKKDLQSPLHNQMVRQVASVYASMMAAAYGGSTLVYDRALSRYGVITQSFRRLLTQNYKEEKSPAGYAERLNLSVNYLNEAVRAETGLPVRYWIQYTVVLEAKRLLCYTPLSIKEIAYTLGYEDHAYFTRLFTKVTGVPPLAFRRRQHGAWVEKYA